LDTRILYSLTPKLVLLPAIFILAVPWDKIVVIKQKESSCNCSQNG